MEGVLGSKLPYGQPGLGLPQGGRDSTWDMRFSYPTLGVRSWAIDPPSSISPWSSAIPRRF